MTRITHVLLADGLPLTSWVEQGSPHDCGLAGDTWTTLVLDDDGAPVDLDTYRLRLERDRYPGGWYPDPVTGWYPDTPYDDPSRHRGPVRPVPPAFPTLTLDERRWTAMAAEVGGEEELRRLTTEPLPDEEVDWERVPTAAVEAVAAVLERIDGALVRWPDTEVRTACRRFLVAAAERAAGVVRAGPVERTAAAVYWAVGRASHLIGPERVLNRDVLAHFGVGSSAVADRARRLNGPVSLRGEERCSPGAGSGTGFVLGRADLLVASRREVLVAERDRILREADEADELAPDDGGRPDEEERAGASPLPWERALRLLTSE